VRMSEQQCGWLYDVEQLANTPSRAGTAPANVDAATEARYRREGVQLIFDVGKHLSLAPHPTLATAAVFYHRFYMVHSFRKFNRAVTALACLLLASKVEETPKKCRDIVAGAQRHQTAEQYARMGSNPVEEVMIVERILLRTIKFDLTVDHPYTFLLEYAKLFIEPTGELYVQRMVQMAWTFVNDSLCTTLCLLWEPEIIAVAMLHLASCMGQMKLNWKNKKADEVEWWTEFVRDLPAEPTLKSICDVVLDLYAPSTATDGAQTTPTTPLTPGQTAGTTPISDGSRQPVAGGARQLPAGVDMPAFGGQHMSAAVPTASYAHVGPVEYAPPFAAYAQPPPPQFYNDVYQQRQPNNAYR